MPDYSKGVIYTIRCLNDPNVYVGSTIQSLSVRMGGHKKDYVKNKVLGKNKEIVKDINDWKIELHELYPCLTKQELHRREGEVIREIGTLNKCIAGRTKNEYYIDNINKIKEKYTEYKEINAEKIKIQKKQHYEKHKEKYTEYKKINAEKIKIQKKQHYENHKEEIKQYAEINAEKITKYRKQYYETHKEKYKENYLKKKEQKNQTI